MPMISMNRPDRPEIGVEQSPQGVSYRPAGVNRATLLLADDHVMMAETLRTVLEPEFEVLEVVRDGLALVESAMKLHPQVIVSDITMPLLGGLEAMSRLRRMGCQAKFVFLTMHQDATWAARAFDLGASGFVLKHSATSELVTAIRETLSGRTYVPPILAREVIQVFRVGAPSHSGENSGRRGAGVELTPRQREVLQLFAEGHSAKEVAKILKISPRTAEFHKASVMKSLGLHSIAELTRYAVRHGLVTS